MLAEIAELVIVTSQLPGNKAKVSSKIGGEVVSRLQQRFCCVYVTSLSN